METFPQKELQSKTIDNVEIRPSQIHGRGLFALTSIPSDKIICQLEGIEITHQQYDEIHQMQIPPITIREWNAIEGGYLTRPVVTHYGFINHSRTPNLKIIRESMQIITLEKISPDTELTLDYRCEPLRPEYLQKALYL